MTTATLEKKNEAKSTKTATRRTVIPQYTVDQKEDAYSLRVILPGVDQVNLNLEVDGQWLKIKASPESLNTEGYQAAHVEFSERDYEAEFRIPNSIDRENISGRLENGILRVNLPKAQEHQRRAIKINAS